jgi:phospholipase C
MRCRNGHDNPDSHKFCSECGLRVVASVPASDVDTSDIAEKERAARQGAEGLDEIDRIVVLMQENRSFDHMIGYLSLSEVDGGRGRNDIEGLKPTFSNPDVDGKDVFVHPLDDTVFLVNPGHQWWQIRDQMLDDMHGFVKDFAGHLTSKKTESRALTAAVKAGDIMGYHTAATVPVYDFLAEHFTVCDHWFSSAPSPTWPNRMFFYAGTSAGIRGNGMPLSNYLGRYRNKMPRDLIVDRLDDAGVEWCIYRGSLIPWMGLFPEFRRDDPDGRKEGRGRAFGRKVKPYRRFDNDCRRGELPPVVFIDGNANAFRDRPGGLNNDDQAPADVARGQELVGEVYESLRANGLLDTTLFVVLYDEHGGFYDHVKPPTLPEYLWENNQALMWELEEKVKELRKETRGRDDPDGAEMRKIIKRLEELAPMLEGTIIPAFTSYGVRVPAFVISGLVEARSVHQGPLDHTSITHSILLKYCPGQRMKTRVHVAPNLGPLITRQRGSARPLPSAQDAIKAAIKTRSRRRGRGDHDDIVPVREFMNAGCYR